MSTNVLLRGGTVVDPTLKLRGRTDIRIRDGTVIEVGQLAVEGSERVVDVEDLIVAPGLIDVHVHLREPGLEWKETIETGTAAAAAGGFTSVFCMPNTEPALDSVVMLEELRRRTEQGAAVRVFPIAAISEARRGERAVDYDALAEAGAVGFSDDGDSTRSAAVMCEALASSRRLGIPVMVHCEEASLTGGSMHAGETSRELGIRGLPAKAEEMMIERDIALAELTGGWLHVCHVSTGRGTELIANARARGVTVTAEVMPHHLTMTDGWVSGCRRLVSVSEPPGPVGKPGDPDTKVNPPLRPVDDALRLLQQLKAGNIDIVSTDHAPHGLPEKQGRSFSDAAFGLSGSELALPLMLALVRAGHVSLDDVISAMSSTPARLWNLGSGSLKPGAPADVTVFDPSEVWTARTENLVSRGSNTPLLRMELQGRVKLVLVAGDERYRDL